jgi:hypothetical protein
MLWSQETMSGLGYSFSWNGWRGYAVDSVLELLYMALRRRMATLYLTMAGYGMKG